MEKNKKQYKFMQLLACIWPVILSLLLQVLIIYAGILLYAVYIVANNIDSILPEDIYGIVLNIAESPKFSLWVSAFWGLANIIVYGLWYRSLKKKEKVYDMEGTIQLSRKIDRKDIALIIILGVCLQFAISLVLTLMSFIFPKTFEVYNKLIESLGMGNSFISLIYTVLMAPIAEELVYRGVVFHKAKKVFPLIIANIFQATFFGIIHMNVVQSTYAFILGLLIGYITLKYNKLWMAILLHFVVNLSGVLISQFSNLQVVTSMNENLISIIYGVLGVVSWVIIFFTLKKLRSVEHS